VAYRKPEVNPLEAEVPRRLGTYDRLAPSEEQKDRNKKEDDRMLSKKLASVGLLVVLMISVAMPLTFSDVLEPQLTLTPNIGPTGTLVVIAGSYFTPNRGYRVFFDINGNEKRDIGEPFKAVKADAGGSFTTTLIVPLVPSDEYWIRADDYPYRAPAVASALFEVKSVFEKLVDIQDDLAKILEALESYTSDILSAISSAKTEMLDAIRAESSIIVRDLSAVIAGAKADICIAINNVAGVVDDIHDEVKAIEGKLDNEDFGLKALDEELDDVKGEMFVVTDHALFDTTGGDTGAKCSSDKTFEFHLVATAYGGPATIRVTFNDGDWIEFHLNEHSDWISFTQAAGGTEGVDDVLSVTVESGNVVGWISIRTQNGANPVSPMENFCETI